LIAAKATFDLQLNDADAKLESQWAEWDAALDAGDEQKKSVAREAMAGLLDRRRYIRNLVNSVNESLESQGK
jgi:hypothetical protein